MLGQGVMFSLWLLFNEFETGFVPFLSTPHPCTRRASFQSAQVGPEARPQLGALSTRRESRSTTLWQPVLGAEGTVSSTQGSRTTCGTAFPWGREAGHRCLSKL